MAQKNHILTQQQTLPYNSPSTLSMSEQDPPKPARRARRKRTLLPADAPDVASPCISICEIDKESGLCGGCYRTLAEIATWSRLPNQERWEIVQSLRDRRREFKLGDQ